jgi:hypothetical protein
MEKIVFYVPTNKFGIDSFDGFKSLKDFYHATALSIQLSSRLHVLQPLPTVLLTDENGKELLVDNAKVNVDKVKLIDEEHYTPIDLYANEFPGLYVKTTLFPFIDIPLNVFNAKLLCFNIHYQNKRHRSITKEILSNTELVNPLLKKIRRDYMNGKLYSLNNSILGSADPSFFSQFAVDVAKLYKEIPKNISKELFFEFIETVYLYYFAQQNKVQIEAVNPHIPDKDYLSFKYFLTERLNIYILGDKRNPLTVRAIEQISKERNPTLFIN